MNFDKAHHICEGLSMTADPKLCYFTFTMDHVNNTLSLRVIMIAQLADRSVSYKIGRRRTRVDKDMPHYRAAGIEAYVETVDLTNSSSTALMFPAGMRTGDLEHIDSQISKASRLAERLVRDDDGQQNALRFLGPDADMPYLLASVGPTYHCLHNASSNVGLVLTVDLSRCGYLNSSAISNNTDVKVEVFYNGELAACRFVGGRKTTHGPEERAELVLRFHGRRVEASMERPWTLTADDEPRDGSSSSTGAGWREIGAALAAEAKDRQQSTGYSSLTTEYLEAISQTTPLEIDQQHDKGQSTSLGIIDVVVTQGRGGKAVHFQRVNTEPTRMNDESAVLSMSMKPAQSTQPSGAEFGAVRASPQRYMPMRMSDYSLRSQSALPSTTCDARMPDDTAVRVSAVVQSPVTNERVIEPSARARGRPRKDKGTTPPRPRVKAAFHYPSGVLEESATASKVNTMPTTTKVISVAGVSAAIRNIKRRLSQLEVPATATSQDMLAKSLSVDHVARDINVTQEIQAGPAAQTISDINSEVKKPGRKRRKTIRASSQLSHATTQTRLRSKRIVAPETLARLKWQTPSLSQGSRISYAEPVDFGATQEEYISGLQGDGWVRGMLRQVAKEKPGSFTEESLLCGMRFLVL